MPITMAMCRPETDSRWASPESRKAAMSGGGMPDITPLNSAWAKAADEPVKTASIRPLIDSRSRRIQSIGPIGAWSRSSTGPSA